MADGDVTMIKKYFFSEENIPAREFMEQYKALTDEDKAELAEGIRNSSLTY